MKNAPETERYLKLRNVLHIIIQNLRINREKRTIGDGILNDYKPKKIRLESKTAQGMEVNR